MRWRTSGRQAPAFDARQMLANAVHFTNVGAAFQQGLVDGLFFGQAQAIGWQGEQSRAAARNEAQHQIVLRQTLGQRQNFFRRSQARRIGHGV